MPSGLRTIGLTALEAPSKYDELSQGFLTTGLWASVTLLSIRCPT